MARSNCRGGADPTQIANREREAAEARRSGDIRSTGTVARYLYVAGALAALALLIVLAAV